MAGGPQRWHLGCDQGATGTDQRPLGKNRARIFAATGANQIGGIIPSLKPSHTMNTSSSTFPPSLAPLIKLTTLLIVLALQLFHPAGQAAALPLSVLVLGGAWLVEASIAGAGNWTLTGLSLISATTMPFYLGVLVFNSVASLHLPPVSMAAGNEGPVYVSTSKTTVIPGAAQGGCGSGCGSSVSSCSSSGGCGSASGGCGSSCGSSKQLSVAGASVPINGLPVPDSRKQMNPQMAVVADATRIPQGLTKPKISPLPLTAQAVQQIAGKPTSQMSNTEAKSLGNSLLIPSPKVNVQTPQTQVPKQLLKPELAPSK